MLDMAVHLVHSRNHGELHVVTASGTFGHGRHWRAVLDPTPVRLAHLTAVDGESEEEALAAMLRSVDLYDALSVRPRHRALNQES
jgi:hypothetical protein